MDDTIWFIGLPCDDDRDKATPADRQRLAEVLAEQGFRSAPTEVGSALEVWAPDLSVFTPRVDLDERWMVNIAFGEVQLDEDFEENRGNNDALAKLIGTVSEFANIYLGFVTADNDDDLSFIEEDPPVQLEQPLALVYLGQRYLNDWSEESKWAADPKARWELSNGILLVPASSPLEMIPTEIETPAT